jgi:hypothetical protein
MRPRVDSRVAVSRRDSGRGVDEEREARKVGV